MLALFGPHYPGSINVPWRWAESQRGNTGLEASLTRTAARSFPNLMEAERSSAPTTPIEGVLHSLLEAS